MQEKFSMISKFLLLLFNYYKRIIAIHFEPQSCIIRKTSNVLDYTVYFKTNLLEQTYTLNSHKSYVEVLTHCAKEQQKNTLYGFLQSTIAFNFIYF